MVRLSAFHVSSESNSTSGACPAGEHPVSVIGGIGTYCVKSSPCSGVYDTRTDLTCPGAGATNDQDDHALEFGSCCSLIRTDISVIGCVSQQFDGVECIRHLPGEPTPVPTTDSPSPSPGVTPSPGLTPSPGDPTPSPGDPTPSPGDLTPSPGDLTPSPGDLTPSPGDGTKTPSPGGVTPTPQKTDRSQGDDGGQNIKDNPSSGGMGVSAVIGIILGSLVIVAIIFGLLFFRNKSRPGFLPTTAGETLAPGAAAGGGAAGALTPRASVALL